MFTTVLLQMQLLCLERKAAVQTQPLDASIAIYLHFFRQKERSVARSRVVLILVHLSNSSLSQ